MKHIKGGVQNYRLFVKSRFMYIAIVIDVLVKKNVSIIDNVMHREVSSWKFSLLLSPRCFVRRKNDVGLLELILTAFFSFSVVLAKVLAIL